MTGEIVSKEEVEGEGGRGEEDTRMIKGENNEGKDGGRRGEVKEA